MKKARLSIMAFGVECPYCEESVEEPKMDSQMWVLGDVKPGDVITCACGRELEIPLVVRDNYVR